MKSTSARRAILPGIAALALLVSACGASNEDTPAGSDGGSEAPSEASGLTGTLKGAGATSQEKAQEAWSTAVQGLNEGFTVEYNLTGSTDGRSMFTDGAVAFAGTDSALTDEEGELTAATEQCGSEPLQVPAYVSSIAIFFNLTGITELNMSADTIAKIFNGDITTWNDPAIAEANPDADLPDTDITPVHRSDESGTTKNFTDYLGKAAPETWTYEAEDAFPVDGEAADGTSGVVKSVEGNEGFIGYADNSQVAEGDGRVAVAVGDTFVGPSPEGAAKTVEVSPPLEGVSDLDMAVAIDRTTTEDGAYPVVLLSYLVACTSYDDAETEANVKGYLSYIVSDAGQQASAEYAGSAPLTAATAEQAQEIVARIGE